MRRFSLASDHLNPLSTQSPLRPIRGRYFRVGPFQPPAHTLTSVPDSTSHPGILSGHSLRIDTATTTPCNGPVDCYSPFPTLPLRPPHAGKAIFNSKPSRSHICDIYLQPHRWPTIVHSPSEENSPRGLVSTFLPSEHVTPLIHVPRGHHHLQEPPHSRVTPVVPQTGPTPSNNPTPRSPEDAPQMQCGWMGCGARFGYDRDVISRHFETAHRGSSRQTVCQWGEPDGDICGMGMLAINLPRHTINVHAVLMDACCEWCGDTRSKEHMPQHQKVCTWRCKRWTKLH